MNDKEYPVSRQSVLRLQTWLSPAFPVGAFSYSHGLEWAIHSGRVIDRESLVEWMEGDLRFGSIRNEAVFFAEAWRNVHSNDCPALLRTSELAAAFRSTSELSAEASQQALAYLVMIRQAWPDALLDWLGNTLKAGEVTPSASVVLGARSAKLQVALELALPLFLQAYIANLVTAAVRLVPLGQVDGQLAIAELEPAVLAVAAEAGGSTLEDIGSAALMVDIASMLHETQQPRIFRT